MKDVDRGSATALLGQSQRLVVQQYGVHESTKSSLVGNLLEEDRTERLRVTLPRQDRDIRLLHLRNRLLTATDTVV